MTSLEQGLASWGLFSTVGVSLGWKSLRWYLQALLPAFAAESRRRCEARDYITPPILAGVFQNAPLVLRVHFQWLHLLAEFHTHRQVGMDRLAAFAAQTHAAGQGAAVFAQAGRLGARN